MHTGVTSVVGTFIGTAAVLAATIVCSSTAGADPGQDERFLALLEQQDIPAVDGIPELIDRAHRACAELDGGTPASVIVDELDNTMYQDNPTLHLVPGRVTRTSTKFVNAAVGAYCPGNQDKLP